MKQELEFLIDELLTLDPTDDGFDEWYMAYLELMSIQAVSSVSEKMKPDDDSPDFDSPSPVPTLEKSYSLSPEDLQAILT